MAEASSVDDLDVSVAVESKAALQSVVQRSEAPGMEESQVLLCNLASIYTTQASPAGPPSKVAFIRGLLKASGSSIASVTEVVKAAEKLKGGRPWTVDSRNCLAALLALTDRQPHFLNLIARPDEPEGLPAAAVAAVGKAVIGGRQVRANFIDSFLKPEDTARDLDRLEHLTKNTSLRLTFFFGHLDAAGIGKLPNTILRLGLAIGSATDARTVSDLRPWDLLYWLGVSVSRNVAAQDLRPLPSVPSIALHFPGLTDARVDSVRPAKEALVGDKEFWTLCLPDCQLTAAGTCRLGRLLHGGKIGTVWIETSGPWRPGAEEKQSVKAEFCSAVECCGVVWHLDWLYNR